MIHRLARSLRLRPQDFREDGYFPEERSELRTGALGKLELGL